MPKLIKQCPECGYSSEGMDSLKCPVCGSIMISIASDACNRATEKEWNNNYHNDFEEKTKTGSYCDPRLEKYTNGGMHFHIEPTQANNDEEPDVTKSSMGQRIVCFLAGFLFGIFLNYFSIILFIIMKKAERHNPASIYATGRSFTKGLLAGIISVIFVSFILFQYQYPTT